MIKVVSLGERFSDGGKVTRETFQLFFFMLYLTPSALPSVDKSWYNIYTLSGAISSSPNYHHLLCATIVYFDNSKGSRRVDRIYTREKGECDKGKANSIWYHSNTKNNTTIFILCRAIAAERTLVRILKSKLNRESEKYDEILSQPDSRCQRMTLHNLFLDYEKTTTVAGTRVIVCWDVNNNRITFESKAHTPERVSNVRWKGSK